MKKFKLDITDTESIIFRTITAEEADRFYQLVQTSNPLAEEYIFNTVTDNKYDIDDLNAGVIVVITYLVFKLSGAFKSYLDIIDRIEDARKLYSNNLYHRLFYAKIIAAIPGVYKLEDLQNKTLNELLELCMLAESITGAPLFNTKEMRDALTEGTNGKKKSKNKVINSITKEELAALKATLQSNEHDGSPIEYM